MRTRRIVRSLSLFLFAVLALVITVRAQQPAPAAPAQPAPEAAPAAPAPPQQAVLEKSVHGAMACTDCHVDLPTDGTAPAPGSLAKVECGLCHSDMGEQYAKSVHAKSREAGGQYAASCADCHGTHDILPSKNPAAHTYHLNLAQTCSKCHGNDELVRKGAIPRNVGTHFADSIHGQALSKAGLVVAPTCSDCHGSHEIVRPKDPASPVAMTNVPATCGKCHEGIQHQFQDSVHGKLLAAGGPGGGPACQTCHTAHSIQRGETAGWQLSVIGQCGTCHSDRMGTFRDTFHGQVTALGYRGVAGCADCHGAHQVLPASDPRSPVAPANLVKTCGKCHENANENFVKYDPHADKGNRDRNPILFFTSKFMTVLLAGVFGFFGLHTALWFNKERRVRKGQTK